MFFKKKESNPTPQTETNAPAPEASPVVAAPISAITSTGDGKPVYQKPVLRRYDQIDQVKPYGPSEI
ncbi:hypothetical protein IAD21_05285 [Abditibacteriota bacterium]|nr:hypothetical protein IAD21_05285 [Abditibacteriota bacterium]